MNLNAIVDALLNELIAKIDPAEFQSWVDMEKDHTDGDEEGAKQIVIDHIKEHGIKFYPEYKKFLESLKNIAVPLQAPRIS